MKKITILIIITMIIISGLLTAESEEIINLEPVVILDDLIEKDHISDPLSITETEKITTEIIDEEDIKDKGARTVVEALENTANINVTEQYRKYRKMFTIRGESPVVLLNGNYIGDDTRALYTIPSELVERIEIIKNSSSLSYASGLGGNISGIVNIITKKSGKNKKTFKIEGGSFNTFRSSFSFNEFKGRNGFLFNITRDITGGPDGKNAKQDFQNLHLNATRRALDGSMFNFCINIENNFLEIPDDEIIPGTKSMNNENWLYDPWKTRLFNLVYDKRWNSSQNTIISAFYNRRDAKNIWNSLTSVTPSSSIKDIISGINVKHIIKGNSYTTRTGFQFSHIDNPTGKLYYVYKGGRELKDYGLYFQNEKRFKNGVVFDFGVRKDKRHIVKDTAYWGNKGETIIDKWEKPVISYSTGIRKDINKNLTLAARFGVGNKKPRNNLTQSGISLLDEKQKSIDISMDYIKNDKESLRLNLFKIEKENGIITDGTVAIAGETYNAYKNQDMESKGFELSYLRRLNSFFDLRLGYGYTKNDDSTAELFPRYNWNTKIKFHKNRDDISLSAKYVSSYKNYENEFAGGVPTGKQLAFDMGNFYKIDLTWFHTLNEDINRKDSLYIMVNNLTDRKYYTTWGHHNPDFGRRVYFGYKREFN